MIDLISTEGINPENFKLKEVPKYTPRTLKYKQFWSEQWKYCLEGYWSGGYWMPPSLYFYINFWKIKLNKTKNSTVKVLHSPFLRDLEWVKHRLYMEAKGFSGFEGDVLHHCEREYKDYKIFYDKKSEEKIFLSPDEEVPNKFDQKRYNTIKYMPARDYLKTCWTNKSSEELGLPLYNNQAKNIVDIESRGTGKTYNASGILGHNFVTDGAISYDHWKNEKPSSESLVGAIDTFYSNRFLNQFKQGFFNLPGAAEFNGRSYPAPFSKRTTGSLASGKTLIAAYEEYKSGTKTMKGSGSEIHHRSFKDDPTAANGTRPGLAFIEEAGFFNILDQAMGQLKECTADGASKFGVIWIQGTGGDMEGGSSLAVKSIFENPEEYDCLSFKDEYEGNSSPIGFFVPAYLGLNQYKNSKGVTDIEGAKDYLHNVREKLKKGKSKKPYNNELQQRPLVPSEAFLVSSGNIFPIADMKDHLKMLEHTEDDFAKGLKGRLTLDDNGNVGFQPDLNNELKPAGYPVRKGKQEEGCVVIWGEVPEKVPPRGQYIAATDPYNQDDAESVSLGSTFIYKRLSLDGELSEYPIAEYTGRPKTAKEYHENVRRLCMLFNAENLYENQFNGLKMHFEHMNSLQYLAYTPTILKSTANTKVSRTYGLHMSKDIKSELEMLTSNWLTESIGDGKMNLHKIYSKPLLEELIAYNEKGNFDRVISFMLLIAHKLQVLNTKVEKKKKEVDPFFKRKLYTK